jgi:hypothetical protein
VKPLEADVLVTVHGGLQWEKFGQSRNVEDRRPAWAKRRDDQWWRQTHPAPPLPPRRPEGL